MTYVYDPELVEQATGRTGGSMGDPAAMRMMSTEPDCDTIVDELHTLHNDFARWLGAPDATDALEQFATQLDPEFSMVHEAATTT